MNNLGNHQIIDYFGVIGLKDLIFINPKEENSKY